MTDNTAKTKDLPIWPPTPYATADQLNNDWAKYIKGHPPRDTKP